MTNIYFSIQGPGGKTKSESIRVSQNALRFGPMEWIRANTVPDMSYGRPGDVVIVDTTDKPSTTPVIDQIPTGVGIWMKSPLGYNAVPVGNTVIGYPAGNSTAGDIININGGDIILNPPYSSTQAVADVLASGIPNLVAYVLGEAICILDTAGGSITVSDTNGTPSKTLGLYSRESLVDAPANGFWLPMDVTAASLSPSAPMAASFLTLAANASLGNERVFTAGTGVKVTDGGAGGPFTVEHDIIGVPNVLGETLDPTTDKILIHNDSTNRIEQTTLDVLLSAPGTITAKEAVQLRTIDSTTNSMNVGTPLPDLTLPNAGTSVVITRVALDILSPYNVATTITIGDAGVNNRLMTNAENDPTLLGIYETLPNVVYPNGQTQLTITITGATTGSSRLIVDFIII